MNKLPPDIDTILFDCFNTLIDELAPTGLCSIPQQSIDFGFFSSQEEFFKHYIPTCRRPDGRETQLHQRLGQTLASSKLTPKISPDQAIPRMIETWLTEYPRTVRPAPGVQKMLHHWHKQKKLAVVSNFFLPNWPQDLLKTHGLAHYFDFILNSADVGYRKPDPQIYRHAMTRLGKPPSQAATILFIGDRVDLDIDPPRSLGMRVLHYKNPPPGTTLLHETPQGVDSIDHWDQFR
ncbi:MAG: HAD family hydrolase [Tepidisphaeraceae bacterium]